jgi:hypothetical protein
VERYIRLAQYAVARAAATIDTGATTNEGQFGFVYIALGLLAPADDSRYSIGDTSDLAIDAIALITEATR